MPLERRYRLMLAPAGILALLAVSERWLRAWRPEAPESMAQLEVLVTSPADKGLGSLREAIFAADRALVRTRIRLATGRVVLRTPLPPLVNPAGVVIDAGNSQCEIDARNLEGGPVLDLAAPGCAVLGLRIRGARDQGILARDSGLLLRRVGLFDCGTGVQLAEGADDLRVEDSRFESNGTGIHLPPTLSRVSLRRNVFREHDQAAVWAVARRSLPGPLSHGLTLHENRFEHDRVSVVMINVPGEVEHNEFSLDRETSIYLTGAAVVRNNRIRSGASLGIFADGAEGALIENNELDHNRAVGILLRASNNSVVRRNRVYLNGYGIATVFGQPGRPNLVNDNLVASQEVDGLYVVGGSPILRNNRALRNRAAGLRILDFIPRKGPRLVADPLDQGNTLQGNLLNSPVRGEYRAPRGDRETDDRD